jgi:hypothetical protein
MRAAHRAQGIGHQRLHARRVQLAGAHGPHHLQGGGHKRRMQRMHAFGQLGQHRIGAAFQPGVERAQFGQHRGQLRLPLAQSS